MFKIGDVLTHRNDNNRKVVVIGFEPITGFYHLEDKYSYDDSFYDVADNWILEETNDQTKETTHCWHNWAKYDGFIDKFQYCTKCDTKRGYNDE